MWHICVPLGYPDPKKPALRGLFLRASVSLLKGPLHVAYAATRCAICLPLGVKGAPEWGCLCAPDAFSACRVPAICGHPQHDGAFFPDRAVPWLGTPDLCGAMLRPAQGISGLAIPLPGARTLRAPLLKASTQGITGAVVPLLKGLAGYQSRAPR